jgi:hypothetical protein
MNMASSAPPNAKPSSTIGPVSRNSSSASEAPKSPRPTVIIPATPPVRNAIRNAGRCPPAAAAAATRTLLRVASVIPMKPTIAEKSAPMRKKTALPSRVPRPPSATGSRRSSRKTMTAKTASVRNCRRRNALAPSWIASAISRIAGVP